MSTSGETGVPSGADDRQRERQVTPRAFDIFCRVIDNFGDAGVCWRLSRQLAAQGFAVRLWLDRRETLAKMLPALAGTQGPRTIDRVRILPWERASRAQPPRDGVVIEAFACNLPQAYEAQMLQRHCLWINLEYLSAESWVEQYHGLPSLQPSGVPKYFYFPGFTRASGGLLREPGLPLSPVRAGVESRRARLNALTGVSMPEASAAMRYALLFCYADAPIGGLQAGFAALEQPTCLLVPGTSHPTLRSQGMLHVQHIPFVPQARFDELLSCCDLNFVRGEDSLVRAIWTGAPFVWQVYPQEDAIHLQKLEAWLSRAAFPAEAQVLQRAWNGHDDDALARALRGALRADSWAAWKTRCAAWSHELALQPDLASNLIAFCQNHSEKS